MQGKTRLTQKEFLYLEDCLKAERLAIKKCEFFGEQSSDPEVREICLNLANRHQQHYNTLLQHLHDGSDLNIQ